ncbi:MAG: WD40/YVTN/BNR-like repeat-containing protein, partial [Pyrinomonadaceae bacterium]
TAYLAATMYKWDDFRTYLYKTNDYGKSWKKITNGIPQGAFTRVIREDPNKRGLLYAGTETGMFISFDDGGNWQSMQFNLPVVPITDLAVHKRERDLVAATQGRSFWVFDDLPLVHQLMDHGGLKVGIGDTRLFRPEDTYRMQGGGGTPLPATAIIGKNPPNGVVVYYSLKTKPTSDLVVEFLDAGGKSIQNFTAAASKPSASPTPAAGQAPSPAEPGEGGFGGAPPPVRPSTDVGLNRLIWDMRHPDVVRFPGMILWAGETRGPRIVPGSYQVRLTVEGKTMTESFSVIPDPRVAVTSVDYAKQLELALKIRDKLTETHNAIIQIRDVRRQLDDLLKRVKDQPNFKVINDAASGLNKNLAAIEETLYQTKNQSNQDPLNYPIRLNNKLAALAGVIARADAAPTDQSLIVYTELVGQIDSQLQNFANVMKTEVPAFNQLIKEQNVPAVVVKSSSEPPR